MLHIPIPIRWLIWWLYQQVEAFSRGIGNNGKLFDVKNGVKTGCPLSSLLFLLGVNPVVDMFNLLSDGPKMSCTRVCADDFGSALRCLSALRTHASIFKLATRCTGLKLKSSKCVLVVTCVELSEVVVQAIRSWLRAEVPLLADIDIQSSGKYLGWFLGQGSVQLSFKEPLERFSKRLDELVGGVAPAPLAMNSYNQKLVPLISYVAQFAVPSSDQADLPAIEQHALHRLLRIPPSSMSRDLLRALHPFVAVEPLSLKDYAVACMYRFAHAHKEYLLGLEQDIRSQVGDELSLANVNAGIPSGGINSPPILGSLLCALRLEGSHSVIHNSVNSLHPNTEAVRNFHAIHNGVFESKLKGGCLTSPLELRLNYGVHPHTLNHRSVQSCILRLLRPPTSLNELTYLLSQKLTVTLGKDFSQQCRVSSSWFRDLQPYLASVSVYLRICWLKSVVGGWTTSHRMHDPKVQNCIFGCVDAKDSVFHYFQCPILWLLANEVCGFEYSLLISERLCLESPSIHKLQRLAVAHGTYHACRNDPTCLTDGTLALPATVQSRGREFAKAILYRARLPRVTSSDGTCCTDGTRNMSHVPTAPHYSMQSAEMLCI